MISDLVKKAVINVGLILNSNQKSLSFSDIIQENSYSNQPFRALLVKNVVHNFYDTYNYLHRGCYRSALGSITLCGCSCLTCLTYPATNDWSYRYSNKQALLLSAVTIISCCDTIAKPFSWGSKNILAPKQKSDGTNNNRNNFTLAEATIYTGIALMPLFYSFKHFSLNVNK